MTAAEQLAMHLRPDEIAELPPRSYRRRGRVHLRLIEQIPLNMPTGPRTLGECPDMREDYAACPWISCRYHLWNYPPRVDQWEAMLDGPDRAEWPPTCAIEETITLAWDALEGSGYAGLGPVGERLGVSRERARQIIEEAGAKLRRDPALAELAAAGEIDGWLAQAGWGSKG
jgi:hypothetical protein